MFCFPKSRSNENAGHGSKEMSVFSFTRSTTEMKSYIWLSVTTMGFLLSHIGVKAASQCSSERSISGMFLKGHTFRTVQVEGPFQCVQICKQEKRCQSYNFVITNKVCELNNRIKEARPEDFLPDENRFYMKRPHDRGTLLVLYFIHVVKMFLFVYQGFHNQR